MNEGSQTLPVYLAIVVSVIISLLVNHRVLNRMDKNFDLSRKTLEEMMKERLLSTYPLLSQKIDIKTRISDIVVEGADETIETHFMLYIKNFGKGPAINQTLVYYRFYQGEDMILQNPPRKPITGAHDIIAPLDLRSLNLTKLFPNDWNLAMTKRYDNVWIRLPHEDLQRNKCCTCTKYIYQPHIRGKYGKIDRYWYFSAIPEISSERCKKCDWR